MYTYKTTIISCDKCGASWEAPRDEIHLCIATQLKDRAERAEAELAELKKVGAYSFHAYANEAAKTAVYSGAGKFSGLSYAGLGLAGEAGEVADKIKKLWRDHNGVANPDDRGAIAKELGDVLWYVAAVAREINLPLALIAEGNVEKLRSRQVRDVLAGSGDDR